VDPFGSEAGDPNLYRYVSNAPTISVDPLGLQGLKIQDQMLHLDSARADRWFYKGSKAYGVFFWGVNFKLDEPAQCPGVIAQRLIVKVTLNSTKPPRPDVTIVYPTTWEFWNVAAGSTEATPKYRFPGRVDKDDPWVGDLGYFERHLGVPIAQLRAV